MKKLLFTLAALLMAGGMFAQDNYCYIEDFTITEESLDEYGEMNVPIAVHAENYFSGWQVEIICPAGMEIVAYGNGADANVTYKTNRGRDAVSTPMISANDDLTKVLGAHATQGYTQVDGTWTSYGAVCWAPGELEEIAYITVSVADDFKGGEITVISKLSNTPSELFTETFGPSATGVEFTKTTTVTVEGGQEEPKDFQGTVKVTVDESGNVTATYTPAEGEPENFEISWAPTKVEPGTTEVTTTVTAEGYNTLTDKQNVTYTPDATAPVITFTPGETGVTISVEPCTSYEVIVDGENMGQINFVEKTWEEQHIVVNATNAPENYNPATATDDYDLAAKDLMDLEGTVTFGEVDETGKVHVTYTGDEDVTITITTTIEGMDEPYEFDIDENGDIQLPGYGTFELVATIEAEHYNTVTQDPVERTWEEPAYQTPAPTVVPSVTDDAVTITATGEGTVVLYVQTINDDGTVTTTTYTNPASVTIDRTDEAQYVTYWATAQRDEDALVGTSETVYQYEIPAKEVKVYDVIAPTVSGAQNDEAYVITVTNNDPYATVTLYVTTYDPETGAPVKTPYTEFPVTIPRTNEDQMISFYADATLDAAPEGYTDWNNASTPSQSATVEALPELTGEIEISDADQSNGHFTVTYTGPEDVTLTVPGYEAVRNANGTWTLPTYGEYEVTAKATADNFQEMTKTKTLVWEAPLPELKGEVFVSVDENGNITAQYAPAEGEPTEGYTITTDPTKLTDYGKNIPVTVTVEHEGYEPLEVEKTVDYNAPVTEQTAAPGDDLQNKVVKFGDVYYNTYELTLIETEPSTIYYRVGTLNPETGLDEYTDWMTYEDMLTYTTPGTYMVEAYAVANGKTQSTTIQVGFSVSEATSIEELFADKNIASVRYFNMAGQEMQEANGICVTVYTFTDGTQTAIKVMK